MILDKPESVSGKHWDIFNQVLAEVKQAYTVIIREHYPPEHYQKMTAASKSYRDNRPSEEYSRMGKVGAQNRWHPKTANTGDKQNSEN